MSDPLGVDPTPTPPHPLVVKSDALDAKINGTGLIAALQQDQARITSISKRFMTLSLVSILLCLVVIYSLFKVAQNTSAIQNDKRARHVFCLETNINNAVARAALVTAFPDAPNPTELAHIAYLLFPTRDCSQDPPIIIDTTPIEVLPEGVAP